MLDPGQSTSGHWQKRWRTTRRNRVVVRPAHWRLGALLGPLLHRPWRGGALVGSGNDPHRAGPVPRSIWGHGGLHRPRAGPAGAGPVGAGHRRARRLPPVQGHAVGLPRSASGVVRLPRRPHAAPRHPMAGRRGAGRARSRGAGGAGEGRPAAPRAGRGVRSGPDRRSGGRGPQRPLRHTPSPGPPLRLVESAATGSRPSSAASPRATRPGRAPPAGRCRTQGGRPRAEAALLAVGETRAKHSGIISGFVHLLVRGGQLDEESGRLLRSLFERRNEADYRPVKVPVEEADAAIRDAERVVRAVERWLAQPRRGN
jgi:hypothetical protein